MVMCTFTHADGEGEGEDEHDEEGPRREEAEFPQDQVDDLVVRYSDDVNDPQVEGFVTIIDNLAARARFMQPF